MKRLTNFVEKKAFGVCTAIGDRLGISISTIRLYFIYSSFFTFGSPVILYLALAFWMNVKRALRRRSQAIWN